MPFVLLHSRLPTLAERETRTVQLFEEQNGLPADTYSFVEMFCNEAGCDCRRVVLGVWSERGRRQLATLNFGWESRRFYEKWLRSSDPDEVAEIKGPALMSFNPQTEYSPALLHLARQQLFADPAYVERIKRHYDSFRETTDRPAPPARAASGSERNAPCSCGSGKKQKKCCGATSGGA